MSEDLAIDVGLTADSTEFKSFVDKVDSILEYGCTSVTRVVRDIVDKCHTSELDIAQDVIRACATKKNNKHRTTQQWWETYEPTTGRHRRYHEQNDPPKRKRSSSPLKQRQQHPRSPPNNRYNDPRNDRHSPSYGRNSARETRRNPRNGRNRPRVDRNKPRDHRRNTNVRNGRNNRHEQHRRHDRRPMNLSFDRPNTGRSRGYRRGGSHDERRHDDQRTEHNRKRPMSPLFDNNSDVPTWPTSKRRRQY